MESSSTKGNKRLGRYGIDFPLLVLNFDLICSHVNLIWWICCALGGDFFPVQGSGIKAIWWDKLRSMCVVFFFFFGLVHISVIITLAVLNFQCPHWRCPFNSFSSCRYADIYTSRVSNFLHYTPFMYFRSQEQVTRVSWLSWSCFVLENQWTRKA